MFHARKKAFGLLLFGGFFLAPGYAFASSGPANPIGGASVQTAAASHGAVFAAARAGDSDQFMELQGNRNKFKKNHCDKAFGRLRDMCDWRRGGNGGNGGNGGSGGSCVGVFIECHAGDGGNGGNGGNGGSGGGSGGDGGNGGNGGSCVGVFIECHAGDGGNGGRGGNGG
jgi:hypothetical protein